MKDDKIYMITVVLLCCLSIATVGSSVLGACMLLFVPLGLRSLVLASIMCLLAGMIYLKSDKKEEINSRLLTIGRLWSLWLIYLFVRSEMSSVGIWKFEAIVMKVFAPCMVVIILYVHNPDLFKRYLINSLLGINIFLAICTLRFPNEEELYDVSIWLSRGIAVSVFFLIIELRFNRRLLLTVPLIGFFLGVMIFIGSRGPVAALIITLVLYGGVHFRRKIVAIPLIAYVVFLVVIAYLFVPPFQGVVASFLTHGNRMEIEDFADDRLAMVGPTIEIVRERPLFGVGLGNWGIGLIETYVSDKSYVHFDYREMFSRDYYYWPHNIVVEISCELGLAGIILFALLFYPVIRRFNIQNKYNYVIVMGLMFAFTSSALEGNAIPLVFSTISYLVDSECRESSCATGEEMVVAQ